MHTAVTHTAANIFLLFINRFFIGAARCVPAWMQIKTYPQYASNIWILLACAEIGNVGKNVYKCLLISIPLIG